MNGVTSTLQHRRDLRARSGNNRQAFDASAGNRTHASDRQWPRPGRAPATISVAAGRSVRSGALVPFLSPDLAIEYGRRSQNDKNACGRSSNHGSLAFHPRHFGQHGDCCPGGPDRRALRPPSTILRGPVSGLISGLGAALADTLFGCIAAFGLTAISDALIQHQAWLKLGGGAFLCAIGFRSFTTEIRNRRPRHSGDRNLVRDFLSTFLLTLTNPVTILALAAISAALGVRGARPEIRSPLDAWSQAYSSATAPWWLLLAAVTLPIRGRLDPNHLEWVARVAGILLLASGLYVLASLAWPHLM